MASHSAGHSSGPNSNQDGLSNIRMIVRRIFEWGSIGIVVIIIVIAVKYLVPWGSFTNPFTQTGVQTASHALTTSGCPGGAHKLSELGLGSDWTEINPNGCRFIYDIKEGSIELSDGEEEKPASGWIDFLPSQARLTSGPVKGYYAYCPTTTGTQQINWDCLPV